MASGKRMWLVCHGIEVDCRPMPMAGRQNIAHIRLYFSDACEFRTKRKADEAIYIQTSRKMCGLHDIHNPKLFN
jgi:hypothetical protein